MKHPQSKPHDLSERTFLESRIIGDPDDSRHQFNEYAEKAGVQHCILRVADATGLEPIWLPATVRLPMVAGGSSPR